MEVYFSDRKLSVACASEREMRKRYGSERARRLATRLQQLRIADTLADLRLVTARVHELTGDRVGMVALDLDGPYRLVLQPLADGVEGGPLRWDRVKAVVVIEIVDYH